MSTTTYQLTMSTTTPSAGTWVITSGTTVPNWEDDPPPKKKPLPKKPRGKKAKTINSVIISHEKREEIRSAINQVKDASIIFTKWGFGDAFEKGTAVTLLFWGIPGTGKTLMAQAISNELHQTLKIIGTAEIESAEPGAAERTIKEVFAYAKENNQIILFDECDSLLADRNEVGIIMSAQINCLLGEIENFNGVIIFTTNRLGKLDPALERRISAKIEFVFPDEKTREAIWRMLIPKKAPLDKDVDFAKLASYPLCGGNIKNVILNAARMAAYKKTDYLKMEHFIQAIEKESKAIQSFVAEYEGAVHSSVGYKVSREPGKIVIDKDIIKEKGMGKIAEVMGK